MVRTSFVVGLLVVIGCSGGHGARPATGEPAARVEPPAADDDATDDDAAAPDVDDVAPADPDALPAETADDACSADDECLVTNWPGCCSCPQCSIGQPMARSRVGQQRAEAACAVASCDASICDIAGMCPPGEDASHFVPRCRGGVCVGDRR